MSEMDDCQKIPQLQLAFDFHLRIHSKIGLERDSKTA